MVDLKLSDGCHADVIIVANRQKIAPRTKVIEIYVSSLTPLTLNRTRIARRAASKFDINVLTERLQFNIKINIACAGHDRQSQAKEECYKFIHRFPLAWS